MEPVLKNLIKKLYENSLRMNSGFKWSEVLSVELLRLNKIKCNGSVLTDKLSDEFPDKQIQY
jgi:hypothetical protein